MILLIDNYDSFSYNLFQQAAAIEPEIKAVRNDALTVGEIEGLNPSHIILSPGPGYPKDAGICEEVVKRLGGSISILGVCLGHQAICEAFGGRIEHAWTDPQRGYRGRKRNQTGLYRLRVRGEPPSCVGYGCGAAQGAPRPGD